MHSDLIRPDNHHLRNGRRHMHYSFNDQVSPFYFLNRTAADRNVRPYLRGSPHYLTASMQMLPVHCR